MAEQAEVVTVLEAKGDVTSGWVSECLDLFLGPDGTRGFVHMPLTFGSRTRDFLTGFTASAGKSTTLFIYVLKQYDWGICCNAASFRCVYISM